VVALVAALERAKVLAAISFVDDGRRISRPDQDSRRVDRYDRFRRERMDLLESGVETSQVIRDLEFFRLRVN
jgi:hypothetical protein